MKLASVVLRTCILAAFLVATLFAPAVQAQIPSGALVTKATLSLHVYPESVGNTGGNYEYNTGDTIGVHRVNVQWDPATAAWNNFPQTGYDPMPVAEPNPANSFEFIGWLNFNVTEIVQGWVNGTYPNFGFLLEQDLAAHPTEKVDTSFYGSRYGLNPSLRPKLVVEYDVPGFGPFVVTFQQGFNGTVEDTWLYTASPNVFGPNPGYNENYLRTRNWPNGSRKWALIRFHGGCTLTPGYWKTHSDFGPAPFDPTWLELGPLAENTLFFGSGRTWIKALWTPPARGNEYFILAHAYIAAVLNGLKGAAYPQEVQDALGFAFDYFTKYGQNGPTRAQVIQAAALLDAYNNGLLGLGGLGLFHCP